MINQDDVLKDYEKYLRENKNNVRQWTLQKLAGARFFLKYMKNKKLSFGQITRETTESFFKEFPQRKTAVGDFIEYLENRNIISLERNANITGRTPEKKASNFDELLDKYIDHISRRELKKNTLRLNYTTINRFFNYLLEHNINDISRVTRKVMSDYALYLMLYKTKDGKSYNAHSKKSILVAVRAFFRFLCKQDILLTDPAQDVEMPKIPNKISRDVPTVDEIDRLINSIDKTTVMGIRDIAMIEVLYGTGLRAAEIYKLEVKDIDFENKLLTVRQGKGKKDRVVPINDTALSWIREYRAKLKESGQEDGDALFLNALGQKILIRAVSEAVNNRTAKAKIQKHLIPHSFRYACATHMLKNGADIRYVQEMLGHEWLVTTQGYTKVIKGDLKKMIRKYHPREGSQTQEGKQEIQSQEAAPQESQTQGENNE